MPWQSQYYALANCRKNTTHKARVCRVAKNAPRKDKMRFFTLFRMTMRERSFFFVVILRSDGCDEGSVFLIPSQYK